MLPATSAEQLPGHLAENVMHFGRVLRAAGLPVGTDRVQLALQALQVAGLESRRDFRATLAACMVDRAEHRAMFDQAFHIFWRDPDLLGRVMAMLLPRVQGREAVPPPPENRRLGNALFPQQGERPAPPKEETKLELDASLTWSEQEQLRKQDFETMSAAEWAAAKRLLRGMNLLLEPIATRRFEAAARPGRVDWRATLRSMGRHGGELPLLRFKRVRERPAPIVLLTDISGSMSRYSRMLLHFAHALSKADTRVQSFSFGTRLTPITRALRERDADLAVARVSHQVQDWSGGTRLAACLHEFNRRWARRTLDSRATVLLVTDGLEHGDVAQLGFEAERLSKSCRRLIWLNPLLRYEGFEPRAAGIKALLPHVDRLLPAHNLDSLQDLGALLSGRPEVPTRILTTMELSNQQALPVSQAIAWDALNDTSLLQQSIPGCEAINPIGENEYEVLMTAAIGPVKAKFKGKLKLSDIEPPNSYTMAFEGQGGAAGHGKGTASVRLEAAGPDDTLLHYAVTASVGGKIAQVGSRLVDMAAQKIANDFFGNFTAVLQQLHPRAEAPVVAPPPSGAWARFVAWLRRLLG